MYWLMPDNKLKLDQPHNNLNCIVRPLIQSSLVCGYVHSAGKILRYFSNDPLMNNMGVYTLFYGHNSPCLSKRFC